MPKYLKILFSIIFIYFLFSYFTYDIFFNIFKNEKFYLMGRTNFSNEKIIHTENKPKRAKAVFETEKNGVLKVTIPENNAYYNIIKDDIQLISYYISKSENKLISYYVIKDENLKTSDTFELYRKIIFTGTIIFLIFAGNLFRVLNPKKFYLMKFGYYREFFKDIIMFSVFVFFVFILYFSGFMHTENYFPLFMYGLSSVFLINLWENKIFKIIVSVLGILGMLFFYKYSLYVVIISFIAYIIILFFKIKTSGIIKKDKKIVREETDDDTGERQDNPRIKR